MRIERVKNRPGLAESLGRLDQEGFGQAWSAKTLAGILQADWYRTFLFWEAGQVVGYGVAQLVVDEGELLRFMILPAYRQKGFGREALACLLRALEGEGMKRMYLEVRQDNKAAQHLYYSQGFEPMGKRRNYYEDGADAYLFIRERKEEA